jgi:DNA-binding transcriptional ArsR family regulator
VDSDSDKRLALQRVFASPVKLRILKILAIGPRTPCALAADLGLAQSTVSNHLAGLHGHGAVYSVPAGRYRFYSISTSYRERLDKSEKARGTGETASTFQ